MQPAAQIRAYVAPYWLPSARERDQLRPRRVRMHGATYGGRDRLASRLQKQRDEATLTSDYRFSSMYVYPIGLPFLAIQISDRVSLLRLHATGAVRRGFAASMAERTGQLPM